MKVATIDNSIFADLCRTITWQFDNATNLIGIIMAYYKNDVEQPGIIKGFYDQSTNQFWNDVLRGTIDISTADDFGLAIWGKLLNCPRVTIKKNLAVGIVEDTILPKELYRKLLIGRFRMLNKNASVEAYCDYIDEVYDGEVKVIDNHDMSITFEATDDLDALTKEFVTNFPEVAFVYPSGVKDNTEATGLVFGFDGQNTGRIEGDPEVGMLDRCSFIWKQPGYSIKTANVSLLGQYSYTGNPIRPIPNITISRAGTTMTLTNGTDFICEWATNVQKGTGIILITGIGKFKDSIYRTFQIV